MNITVLLMYSILFIKCSTAQYNYLFSSLNVLMMLAKENLLRFGWLSREQDLVYNS